MPNEVIHVEPLGGTRVRLTFRTGERGEVDIAGLTPLSGVFEPLSDPTFFSRVRVELDLGTIVWPNGADLCPDVLHAAALRLPMPGSSPGMRAGDVAA